MAQKTYLFEEVYIYIYRYIYIYIYIATIVRNPKTGGLFGYSGYRSGLVVWGTLNPQKPEALDFALDGRAARAVRKSLVLGLMLQPK